MNEPPPISRYRNGPHLPTLQPVESESIESIGYEPALHRLYVRFRESGAVYAYEGVSLDVYEDLIGAESKGRFVNTEIKGRYTYRRVTG